MNALNDAQAALADAEAHAATLPDAAPPIVPAIDRKLSGLARQILDWKPPSRVEAPECFTCGRSYSRGEGRFCSSRCRQGFDDGFPAHEPNYVRRITNIPLGDWRVVAGPPDVAVGSCPWQVFLNQPRRPKRRRKVISGLSPTNSNFVENNPTDSVACKGDLDEPPARRVAVSVWKAAAQAAKEKDDNEQTFSARK
jgi:hypothetical protein